MPYTAEISRINPACILFLLDESSSMDEPLENGTKAHGVALTLNRVLRELIVRCGREEGVRDYFEIGVIGYSGSSIRNALSGSSNADALTPISEVEAQPKRVEDRMQKVSDGAGGLVEVQTKFPVWYDPVASGGTPMRAALVRVAEILLDWCDAHSSSYPPIVIHLTDGVPTDGTLDEVAAVADQLREISTEDGQVLLMNIHVSSVRADPVFLPSSDAMLSDEYAQLLFRMSSVLPQQMREIAIELGDKVDDQARGFAFHAKTEQIVQFFMIGTRPSNLR